ncbi:putative heterokaryon incompatibility [Diplodia seriata]|uniref:Putative heterokaryon incompatibility n=1 Tax=Diplodia seriata TaxID=420778 RepID=A0A0G2F2B0_9PEZI|nr:putative heterokaryon incompatibility [Diplodia seriata]
MLDIPDFDLIDAAFIDDKKPQFSSRQLAQAEQIASASLFHDWMVSPRSARLLVQWDAPTPPRTVGGVSPLSTFCGAMARALQTRGPRFIPLLWFCGRHIDTSDPDNDENSHIGARSMLASLIDQLLRRHDFDTRPLHRDLDLSALQSRSPAALAKLLDWLIRRLPPTTTVVLIVDGVVLFEREEFQDEALPALSGLLRLASDGVSAAAVKVLFASTPDNAVVDTVLCNRCKSLEIDDRSLCSPTDPCAPRTAVNIKVEFEYHDTFPELPDLKSSAEAGCGFCKMLRQTIINKYGDELEKLSTSHGLEGPRWLLIHNVTYIGEFVTSLNTDTGHYGLSGLRAEVDHAGRGIFKKFVGFNVYADRASNPHLKTLAGNYEQHQNGIPIDTIPKTLHDAILVTRVLGIQYLWIDALCIIQDDASDWQQEAIQMGQIYRNAAATIVAAAATTSNQGFLARPRDRMNVRIPYTSSTTTSTPGSGKAKGTFQLWQRVTAHLSEDITVQASAWSTRAWTFQEQHLSTRALYFGTHLTHFQCQRDVAAENSAASSVFWPAPWARELGVQDPARAATSTITMMHNAWFDIVGDYSARALTVAGDKLPALASMAGAIGDALRAVVRDDDNNNNDGYHYCAGLWRGDIVRGLLWKGKFDVFDTSRLSRPDPGSSYYRAPSWSWAAF